MSEDTISHGVRFAAFVENGRRLRYDMLHSVLGSSRLNPRRIDTFARLINDEPDTKLIEAACYAVAVLLRKESDDTRAAFAEEVDRAMYLFPYLDEERAKAISEYIGKRDASRKRASSEKRAVQAGDYQSNKAVIERATGAFDALSVLEAVRADGGLPEADFAEDPEHAPRAIPGSTPCVLSIDAMYELIGGDEPDIEAFIKACGIESGVTSSLSAFLFSLFRASVFHSMYSAMERAHPSYEHKSIEVSKQLMRCSVALAVNRQIAHRPMAFAHDVLMGLSEFCNVPAQYMGGSLFTMVCAISALAANESSLAGICRAVWYRSRGETFKLTAPRAAWALTMDLSYASRRNPGGELLRNMARVMKERRTMAGGEYDDADDERITIPGGKMPLYADLALCREWLRNALSKVSKNVKEEAETAKEDGLRLNKFSDKITGDPVSAARAADVASSSILVSIIADRISAALVAALGVVNTPVEAESPAGLFLAITSVVRAMAVYRGQSVHQCADITKQWAAQMSIHAGQGASTGTPMTTHTIKMLTAMYLYPEGDYAWLYDVDGDSGHQASHRSTVAQIARTKEISRITWRLLAHRATVRGVAHARILSSTAYLRADSISVAERIERIRFEPRPSYADNPEYPSPKHASSMEESDGIVLYTLKRGLLPSYPKRGFRYDTIRWADATATAGPERYDIKTNATVYIGEVERWSQLGADDHLPVKGNITAESFMMQTMIVGSFSFTRADEFVTVRVGPPVDMSGGETTSRPRSLFHTTGEIVGFTKMAEVFTHAIERIVCMYWFDREGSHPPRVRIVTGEERGGHYEAFCAVLSNNRYVREHDTYTVDLGAEGVLPYARDDAQLPFVVEQRAIITADGRKEFTKQFNDSSRLRTWLLSKGYAQAADRKLPDIDIVRLAPHARVSMSIPAKCLFSMDGFSLRTATGRDVRVIVPHQQSAALMLRGEHDVYEVRPAYFIVDISYRGKNTIKAEVHTTVTRQINLFAEASAEAQDFQALLDVITHTVKKYDISRAFVWNVMDAPLQHDKAVAVLSSNGWEASNGTYTKVVDQHTPAGSVSTVAAYRFMSEAVPDTSIVASYMGVRLAGAEDDESVAVLR